MKPQIANIQSKEVFMLCLGILVSLLAILII